MIGDDKFDKANEKKAPKTYTSKMQELDLGSLKNNAYRIDLEIHGIDHSGPSYEGRVFINNQMADEDTPKAREKGYVDSYYIFGHGGCFGAEGHCSTKEEIRRPYDYRRSNVLTPIFKRLDITDFFGSIKEDNYRFTVTIVPILAGGLEEWENWFVPIDIENVVKLEKIVVKTYGGID